VGQLGNLLLNGCYDSVIRVTYGHNTYASTQVGELVAIDVDEGGSVRAVNVDRQGRSNTMRNRFEALGMKFLRLRARNSSDDFAL
jgi:hypothetical protein